jgi:hypothetical protein
VNSSVLHGKRAHQNYTHRRAQAIRCRPSTPDKHCPQERKRRQKRRETLVARSYFPWVDDNSWLLLGMVHCQSVIDALCTKSIPNIYLVGLRIPGSLMTEADSVP